MTVSDLEKRRKMSSGDRFVWDGILVDVPQNIFDIEVY